MIIRVGGISLNWGHRIQITGPCFECLHSFKMMARWIYFEEKSIPGARKLSRIGLDKEVLE